MANIVDRLVARIKQRTEQRIVAAIELPDEAHRCPDCGGDGYVLDVWPHELVCVTCGGTGLQADEREGGETR